jgi:hypothetical protein
MQGIKSHLHFISFAMPRKSPVKAARQSTFNARLCTQNLLLVPGLDFEDASSSGIVSTLPGIHSHRTGPPGFPTYGQYKNIETAYLDSLSPVKRKKALITQEMFDSIWDVLMDPSLRVMDAQFRFWVRKMFTLATFYPSPEDDTAGEAVVLHDGRPVAIKEQLYELLCYCHSLTQHGGRDKTCAIVRQHFSWVPKDLIARFVMICPTCTLRRGKTSTLCLSLAMPPLDDRGSESERHVSVARASAKRSPTPLPASSSTLSISELMHEGAYAESEVHTDQGDSGERLQSRPPCPLLDDPLAQKLKTREISTLKLDGARPADAQFSADPKSVLVIHPLPLQKDILNFQSRPLGWRPRDDPAEFVDVDRPAKRKKVTTPLKTQSAWDDAFPSHDIPGKDLLFQSNPLNLNSLASPSPSRKAPTLYAPQIDPVLSGSSGMLTLLEACEKRSREIVDENHRSVAKGASGDTNAVYERRERSSPLRVLDTNYSSGFVSYMSRRPTIPAIDSSRCH